MKYKGKQGNSYLFECEGEEISTPIEVQEDEFLAIQYKAITVWQDFDIHIKGNLGTPYKDIQTAVSMMQILIDEGEV